MPSELTPAELTLLGLLVEKPRHGYELEEVIADRGMREWTEIGFSSIYYLLTKLRTKGLIADVPGHGRRRVYEPTKAGVLACATAAEAAVAELHPLFPPLLVGLASQPVVPTQRFAAALDQRAVALDERITAVEQAAQRDVPPFVRAIFDYALGQLRAEREWLSGYREEIR